MCDRHVWPPCVTAICVTARHVLVSDSDVVWLEDPTAELQALGSAGANPAALTHRRVDRRVTAARDHRA